MHRALLFLLLLAAALLLIPTTGLAQQNQRAADQKPVEVPPDGFELFRALLDQSGIKPITRKELNGILPWHEMIVIVLGDQGSHNEPVADALQAIHNGGAAFIASDSSMELGVAQTVRARIVSARIECSDTKSVHRVNRGKAPNDPTGPDILEPKTFCPYLVPLTGETTPPGPDAETRPGKLFHGLKHVATNKPGYISTNGFGGHFGYPLAKFPEGCRILQPNMRSQRLPDGGIFALGGDGTNANGWSYEYLAMADHSVFINQMLIEPGTDNLELTYRVIDYLQGPTKRKRCLFIENGKIIEKFDELAQAFKKSKPQSPLPNLGNIEEKLTNFGNKTVDDLQTNNVLNKALLGLFGLPAIVRFFMIIAAIYATWYLMRRMFTTRKPTNIPPPPPVAAAATGPPGVFERRQKELIRRDNLYEPVRDAVRDFFATIGIHGTRQGPKMPQIVISDEVRRPESLRLALRDFWRLAYGPPQEVSMGRWRELEPYFERLQQAHSNGKWHFVLADTPVAAAV